jgi:SAM-dependent methyltransferase
MTGLDPSTLPAPFCDEAFVPLRRGIYDDDQTEVFINRAGDFAVLHPIPETDYSRYQPRAAALGLQAYKKKTGTYERRYEKLAALLPAAGRVLEIGAGDGGFLALIRERHPHFDLACIEPDTTRRALRDQIVGLAQYDDFSQAPPGNCDLVCLFHVLEHIVEPGPFLSRCASLLAPGGRLVLEVPSLDDPLLSLYNVPAYADYCFQKQHPYYYAKASLERLLRSHGFKIKAMMPHQRYGLENHLNWLQCGMPGGNAEYARVFAPIDADYRQSLEAAGQSDAVIAVASGLSL